MRTSAYRMLQAFIAAAKLTSPIVTRVAFQFCTVSRRNVGHKVRVARPVRDDCHGF